VKSAFSTFEVLDVVDEFEVVDEEFDVFDVVFETLELVVEAVLPPCVKRDSWPHPRLIAKIADREANDKTILSLFIRVS
jgi:hypothetical protein